MQGLFSWQSTALGVLLAFNTQPGLADLDTVLEPLLLAAHAAAGSRSVPSMPSGLASLAQSLHIEVGPCTSKLFM